MTTDAELRALADAAEASHPGSNSTTEVLVAYATAMCAFENACSLSRIRQLLAELDDANKRAEAGAQLRRDLARAGEHTYRVLVDHVKIYDTVMKG